MLPRVFKRASASAASHDGADTWLNRLDPVHRAMVDPDYAREINRRSKTCKVCLDLDLDNTPMATLTTTIIDGKQITRRGATIDTNGIRWSDRSIKNCGYCAMISDAIQKFFPDFFWGGWQLPRLTTITMSTGEPILLTIEDQKNDQSGSVERFGIEIYRDASATVPSTMDYIGVAPSGTVGNAAHSSGRRSSVHESSSIRFIKECMEECATGHRKCRRRTSRMWKLPTRILDLDAYSDTPSTGCDNSATACSDIRLIFTSTLPTAELESLSYAALSHSWGISGIDFKLKKDNITPFTNSIPFSLVPATHKDAIVLARRLGFRYLWIDSLCTIQDSKEDTQKETAKMGDIYTNADLTIAAVSSAGSTIPFLSLDKDTYTRSVPVKFYGARLSRHTRDILGSSGLRRTFLAPLLQTTTGARPAIALHARRTLRLVRDGAANNSASWNAPQSISDAVKGPLSLRAWTLQERALASRIVHFTAEGVKFECPTHFITEDGRKSSQRAGYCGHWIELESQARNVFKTVAHDPRPKHPIVDLLQTAHPAFYNVRPASPVTIDIVRLAALRDDIQVFWRTMLRDYTTRAITKRTDYLPALSGVAGRIQNMLYDVDDMKMSFLMAESALLAQASEPPSTIIKPAPSEYVAGLWRDRLIEDLCWITEDAKHHKTPPILAEETDLPSWSWASINHPTVYPIINEQGVFTEHCTVVSCSTNLTESQWNKFGHVTSGELVLRGPVRKAKLTYTGQMQGGSGTVDFGMGAFADLEEDSRLISCDVDVDCAALEEEGREFGLHPDFQSRNETQAATMTTTLSRDSTRTTEKVKTWRRIVEGEVGKWDKAEVWCIKLASWQPNHTSSDRVMSSIDLDFVMVLGRSPRVPGAFQRLGFLQRDYGGKYFDNVGDSLRRMEETDRLLAKSARLCGVPLQEKTEEQIRMREKLKNEWVYPKARERVMRIV